MEVDLQEVCGIDLLDLWRYRISARKVMLHIDRLPMDSHTMTAMRNALTPEQLEARGKNGDASKGRWTNTEMLLASIKDELAFMHSHFLVANGAKNVQDPKPVIRPGVNVEQAQGATDEAKAHWERLRAEHRARREAFARGELVDDDQERQEPDGSW